MIENLEEVLSCRTHGDFNARKVSAGRVEMVIRTCPRCADDAVSAAERKKIEDDQKNRRDSYERRLNECCIPPRFVGQTFQNYVVSGDGQRHAVKVCEDYAQEFYKHLKNGDGLIFTGNTGNGKNHLAIGIAQAIIENGYMAQYITASDFISKMTAWQTDKSAASQDSIVGMMTQPDLLILDEVGVGSSTDFQRDTLFRLIDARYRERKPVILMGNVSMAELRLFVGERSFDRLKQMTLRQVPFTWASYRGRELNA